MANLVGSALSVVLVAIAGVGLISYATSSAHPAETQEPSALISTERPSVQDTSSAAEVQPVAEDTPSPAAQDTFTGKVDNLPDVAKAVLNFTPADNPNQMTSESIRDRVVAICGLNDYVGSTDFPGTIKVSPPAAHGWVRVTWKPGKCGSVGGSLHANPKLIFEISADQEHIRDVPDSAESASGSENAAYDLTH